MSEEPVAAAFIAALNANSAAAYDHDDVPATLPPYFTQVTVSRRFGGVMRGERPTSTLYRATTRAVAKNVTTAREMRRRAQVALEGTTLVIGGIETTPIQFEAEDAINPDDGYFSGLTYWTFAL